MWKFLVNGLYPDYIAVALEESKKADESLDKVRRLLRSAEEKLKNADQHMEQSLTDHEKEIEKMKTEAQAREKVYLLISIVSMLIFVWFY